MAYRIDENECIACGVCQDVCPVSCIFTRADEMLEIREADCIDCGSCARDCPTNCIAKV
ncbi:indolepyruvate ferredoxin oxidoreductase subunit alpha [Heliophilum fasciatum]|uniref:4Fe-4S dicluster protein n=1 Tax=Heliophilum fasciatum TaxID=35700 RepID=A0A4R2RN35_9FIRM|nr:4Fe-4S binding protein [Heliophilum fasciatum]MCW2278394.1 NAD-dependent dihydropyrimidine dehydrogenase PreA subunit [Heliophilum fasciatum]TCP63707.1 4Fe-4S dicluster protein [Heliophilum fasciatum]